MNKIQRSKKLMKAAFAVLFREKKLFLFPFVASALSLAFVVFFLMPFLFYPTGHSVFTAAHWSILADRTSHWLNFEPRPHATVVPNAAAPATMLAGHPVTTSVFILIYFLSMFLATFSNVAFYHEIMQAFNGNAVSIRRGFRFAASRWRAVLVWSLFAGLVGYLIQAIQERVGVFGRIVTGLVGFAWSVACIFIIPTLVRDTETSNPLKLLRNSVGTLRGTWGELIIGFVGWELAFGASVGLVILPFFALYALNGYYLGAHSPVLPWLIGGGIIGVFLMAFFISWISGLVNPVYRCALYIYATEGVIPGSFDKELMDSAWNVKNQG